MSNSGSVTARHVNGGEALEAGWENGVFTGFRPVRGDAGPLPWMAPGLVDLQINGYAGVDFQQDGLTVDDLLVAARGLRASGCTRFLLTLITDDWTRLIHRLRHLRELRASSAELSSAIAGWHVEGPFLSGEPGYCGAHDSRVMRDPTTELIEELRVVTGSDPVLLTLAPERAGALAAISRAVDLGMTVSLGHTNASGDVLRRAVEAGATGFTHLGNACPRELDRHDNILWRVFETRGLVISLIPDRIHVSPPLFRLAHRLIAPGSIYYTTDAMSAAGAPPGRYRLGGLELEVREDQVVRQPGKSNFAGSALRPIDGVFRASEMLGECWRSVWDRFSGRPASWMNLPHGLNPQASADFCLLRVDDGGRLEQLEVYWNGCRVDDSRREKR